VVVRRGRPEIVDPAARNSGVSSEAAPLNTSISLNVPLTVPSADAPLSPTM
jgi:hypothetical protein